MSEFPNWYGAVSSISSSVTVVSSTDSKVTMNKRANRRYLRVTNLGPNPCYFGFQSTDAVKASGFRLGSEETFESSVPIGNLIVDTVSVISSASSTGQRLLHFEAY